MSSRFIESEKPRKSRKSVNQLAQKNFREFRYIGRKHEKIHKN
jgi:hypothetical protein